MNVANKENCHQLLTQCYTASTQDAESLVVALLLLKQQLSNLEEIKSTKVDDLRYDDHKEYVNTDNTFPDCDFACAILQINIVRTGSSSEAQIQGLLDECLDLCGFQNAFMAAVEMIQGRREENVSDALSNHHETNDRFKQVSPSCIYSCLHTVRRYLLSFHKVSSWERNSHTEGLKNLLRDVSHTQKMKQQQCAEPLDHDRDGRCEMECIKAFVNLVSLLPSQIANACHACHIALPSWSIRSKFLIRLVECAANMVYFSRMMMTMGRIENRDCVEWKSKEYDVSDHFLYCLVDKCLLVGSTEWASVGMYRFWQNAKTTTIMKQSDNKNQHEEMVANVLLRTLERISSPRQRALLICSMLKYIISQLEMYHADLTWKQMDHICQEYCMPFSMRVLLPVLQSSSMVRDALVEKAILAPSPTADVSEQKLLARCVVLLLASCCKDENDDDDSEDDGEDDGNEQQENLKDRDDKSAPYCKEVLMKHLADVSMIWSESSFVNKTDIVQQRQVSLFIMYSIEFMQKDSPSMMQQLAIQEIISGVSNRLKVSEGSLRMEGMRIAECLAPVLGQTLHFEELDGNREDGTADADADADDVDLQEEELRKKQNGSITLNDASTRRRKVGKKDAKGPIDPDEEFMSDEDDCSSRDTSESDENDSIYSSDSDWDEEGLMTVKLKDDEEDLRVVQKPKYLRECLDLLRADGDDHESACKQEAALSELPGLIRALPPDLSDVVNSLVNELLFLENKFDLPNFTEDRWQSLIALAFCDPATTIENLQAQIFSNNMSLGIRFDILDVMKHAAYELSGQASIDKMCKNIEHERFTSKIAGKRRLVPEEYVKELEGAIDQTTSVVTSENKTRRWGKGRRSQGRNVSVVNRFGPVAATFLYPLIQGFLESKHDEILWGGESGGMLLSNLIITMATFIEYSGNHPRTSVLAKDLFELTWSLFRAENAEVRKAILITISTTLPFLSGDYIVSICIGKLQLLKILQSTAQFDTSEKCRLLASVLVKVVGTSLTIPSLFNNGLADE